MSRLKITLQPATDEQLVIGLFDGACLVGDVVSVDWYLVVL